MIDVHELLRRKENDISRVRREIDALHLVAPLLSDSDESYAPGNGHADVAAVDVETNAATHEFHQDQFFGEAESAESSSDPIQPKRGILRDWFNRAAGE